MNFQLKHKSIVKIFSLLICFLLVPEGMIFLNTTDLASKSKESMNTVSPLASATECVDAWILIGGDRSDHAGWPQIAITLDWVYNILLEMGTPENDIHYLEPEIAVSSVTIADGVSSPATIDNAFSVWAPSKVPANGALGVYILDHGGENFMVNFPHSSLTASDLGQHLDDFETASGCNRIFLAYEACESGSFIDELSKDNRIIMTSTEPDHNSWFSPYAPHRAMFAQHFFANLRDGNSLGDAFVHAADIIDFSGYGDQQKPCIDDNHNGVGHVVNAWGELPSGWDGIDAKDTYITTGCPDFLSYTATTLFIPKKIWVPYNPRSIAVPITVAVENTTIISRVICRVIPEDWSPPDPHDDGTMGGWDVDEDLFQWDLYPDASGNFSGRFVIYNPVIDMDYRMIFVADDGQHGDGIPRPVCTSLGTTVDGAPPADEIAPSVVIRDPYDEEVVNGELTISAKGSDDNSGLDTIEFYIENELVSTTSMPNILPYPDASFILNTTDYKNGKLNITAKATDNAGNTFQHSITVDVNNTESGLLDFLPFDIPKDYEPYIIGGVIGFVGLIIISTIFRKRKKK